MVSINQSKTFARKLIRPFGKNRPTTWTDFVLVLYYHKQDVWKLADFGIASEGTSRQSYSTKYARGTASYRAPELLAKHIYNNKVDIWALGCILFELMCGKKAFSGDFHVSIYFSSNAQPEIPSTTWPKSLQLHLSEIIRLLLAKDPQQSPAAFEAFQLFRSYSEILSPAIVQHIEDINLLLPFPQWYELVVENRTNRELLLHLADLCQSIKRDDAAAKLIRGLVDKYPTEVSLQEWLAEIYRRIGIPETSIAGWRYLVENNPGDAALHHRLLQAFQEDGNVDETIAAWKELVDKHPDIALLQNELSRLLTEKNEIDTTVGVWKELAQHVPTPLDQLGQAFRAKGNFDEEIAGWKQLMELNPTEPWLLDRLASAFTEKCDCGEAVSGWKDVLRNNSDDIWAQPRLADALFKNKNYDAAIAIWEELKRSHPEAWEYEERLANVYEAVGKTDQARSIRNVFARPASKGVAESTGYHGGDWSLDSTSKNASTGARVEIQSSRGIPKKRSV